MRGLRLLAVLAALVLGPPAPAQDRAALVADRVFLDGSERLTAEGAVEVFYKGAQLQARRIVYDSRSDRLQIDGPIVLRDGQGSVLLADQAELSADLTEGVLQSARMVMQDQLQLAANAIVRAGGRYTQLDRVVASSCQVCPGRPTPLWEIRARRVTHDAQTRQLYFDHATLRVIGVPVAYLPRLRLPDPSVQRATGFLPARFRTTSDLGPGILVPYFIALGDSRDLTVTPYLSTGRTRTLNLRYREAYRTGRIDFDGAVSRDTLRPGETRGYLFGEGRFALPRDFRLDFKLQTVSDRAYLLDYGISDIDRLASGAVVSRTRRNEYVSAGLWHYQSIRAGESNATLPSLVGDLVWHRRFSPQLLGGQGGLRFELHGQRRTSDVTADLDGNGQADGRDVVRASLRADWRRNWLFGPGLSASAIARLDGDLYWIGQDPAYPPTVTRLTPTAGLELRWPWVRAAADGGSDVIEPIAQLVWSPDHIRKVPNEDSVLVEFDEGNLFSLDRFPGADRKEAGLRANLGLSWTRLAAEGWSLNLTAGRVFRATNLGQFSPGTGLDGRDSDWLVSARFDSGNGLVFANRAVFDDSFDFAKDEMVLGYSGTKGTLAATYVWLAADPALDRPKDTSEFTFEGGWQITDRWRGHAEGRYDFSADRAARAGVGLQWRNECATVDLSLSRRFTSSTSVQPSTNFDLSVVLGGFGGSASGRSLRRSCGG